MTDYLADPSGGNQMSMCTMCDDTGHVCEDHPDKPWYGLSVSPESCACGGAGMPCPACCEPIPADGSHGIADAFTPRRARLPGSDGNIGHAVLMSGGGMHVRRTDPQIDRIYPLGQWITAESRNGGRVFRRRVIVVEDWTEVSDRE